MDKKRAQARLKHALFSGDSIPAEERVALWRCCLNVPADLDEASLTAEIAAVELDLPNQRVVRMDAERTRSDLPEMREGSMQARLQHLLTHFAKRGYAGVAPRTSSAASSLRESAPTLVVPVAYKQGLNEILAVFLQISTRIGSLSDGLVGIFLARFVARFAPRVYASNDDEFTSLQCSLRLFRLLVQYHAPDVCSVCDQFDVAPELYATPWFLCLMARSNSLDLVLPVWDLLIATADDPGPALFHCVAVAFLAAQRQQLLDCAANPSQVAELPMRLSRATLGTVAATRAICAHALDLFAETPLSFRRLIHNVCYSGAAYDAAGRRRDPLPISSMLLLRLEKRIAVKISVEELLAGGGSRLAGGSSAAGHGASATSALTLGVDGGWSPPSVESTAAEAGDGRTSTEVGAPPRQPRPAAGQQSDRARALSEAAATDAAARGFGLLLQPPAVLSTPPRYFVIDCRPRLEYEMGGRLPTAFHLDPALLQDPEALEAMLSGFLSLKGVHFAIMGSGDIKQWYHAPVHPPVEPELPSGPFASAAGSSPLSSSEPGRLATTEGAVPSASPRDTGADTEYQTVRSGIAPLSADEEDDYCATDMTRTFVLYFLQKGFHRVCEVEGGFTALHQHQAHFLAQVLVNHDAETCMVCTGGGAAARYREEEAFGAMQSRMASSRPPLTPGSAHVARSSTVAASQAKLPTSASETAAAPVHGRTALAISALLPTKQQRNRRIDALSQWFRGSKPAEPEIALSPPPAEDSDGEVEILLFNPRSAAESAASKASPTSTPETSATASATGFGKSGTSASGDFAARRSGAAAARPSAAPAASRLVPRLHRDDLVEGRDAAGMPLLREWVHLEQQLDELERAAESAQSQRARSRAGTSDTQRADGCSASATATRRVGADTATSTTARGGDDAALRAASHAANAAKSALLSFLQPPAAPAAPFHSSVVARARTSSSGQRGSDGSAAARTLPEATARTLSTMPAGASLVSPANSRFLDNMRRASAALLSAPPSSKRGITTQAPDGSDPGVSV